ncbi:hypothetical protein BCM0060_1204 [Bacillus cereus]|nr:hypothetical protein BCM0060_1204 [Bacillus cereus]
MNNTQTYRLKLKLTNTYNNLGTRMTKKRTVIITKLTSKLNIWCKTMKKTRDYKIPSFFVMFPT